MATTININNSILSWAINRAGYETSVFTAKHPHVAEWIAGDKKPTVKQLEKFSKKIHLPFGYLFLSEPPREQSPIPFFRTFETSEDRLNINVFDTILLLQKRQDWLRNYLVENDFSELPFVGRCRGSSNVAEIAESIRLTLNLTENWASTFQKWEEALNHLVAIVENTGVIITFNSVVGNSTNRNIPVEECRGFVLVDKMAPFLFINNSDFKSAQMFTLAHELAHIWTGHSAGFDFRKLQPANHPVEKICDGVAAELLVPKKTFTEIWNRNHDLKIVARFFKVSEIVIARRALDTGYWTKKEFFKFYEDYTKREFFKQKNLITGGDFYTTTKKRLSMTFASHINQAVKSGHLLYRDAYKLTNLKGDTFEKFFTTHF
jgi:Zn-dependent peptidase ImmA (M78 family)